MEREAAVWTGGVAEAVVERVAVVALEELQAGTGAVWMAGVELVARAEVEVGLETEAEAAGLALENSEVLEAGLAVELQEGRADRLVAMVDNSADRKVVVDLLVVVKAAVGVMDSEEEVGFVGRAKAAAAAVAAEEEETGVVEMGLAEEEVARQEAAELATEEVWESARLAAVGLAVVGLAMAESKAEIQEVALTVARWGAQQAAAARVAAAWGVAGRVVEVEAGAAMEMC